MSTGNRERSEWTTSTLGQVCDKAQYGWTTRAARVGSVKFLRTTDITGGPIDWESVPYCEEPPSDLDRFLLRDGDCDITCRIYRH